MREATGGVLLLQLVIVILTVFVFFIASVMQYTRVYRIKGTVINAIERNEGGIRDSDEFNTVLGTAGYDGPYRLCKCKSTTKGTFYSLEIYAAFTMLPQFMSISVPIRGNTRSIESGIFYGKDQTELFGGRSETNNKYQYLCGNDTEIIGCIHR
jgi:hypothetical protein